MPFLLMYMNMLHQSKILVFLSTIDEVEYFHFMLTSLEYRGVNNEHTGEKVEKRNVFSLHGDIDQKARSKTYFEFRKTQVSRLSLRTRYSSVRKLPVEV